MLFFLFKPNWCIRKFILKCLLAPGWNVQGQQVLGVQGSAGDTEVAEPEQSPASPTAGGAPGLGRGLQLFLAFGTVHCEFFAPLFSPWL